MDLGPVEYVVIGFPGNKFKGKIAPALTDLIAKDTIHIIDLVFVKKDVDGSVSSFEWDQLGSDELAALQGITGEIRDLINEDDIQRFAEALEPNTSAAILVWENTWARAFANAVRDANGKLVAYDRIPREIIEAAIQAAEAN